MKDNVNKNTVYNTLKTVFGIIYPLITFPYVSRILMAENIGKINFGNSIVSYFSLLASLGVSTYAIRECSKIRDNREELDNVASQIFSINLLSTVVAYIALAITLIAAKSLDSYRMLICIQSATIIFATIGADWINSAMEDFRFIAIRTIGMQIVSLVLMFIFVHKPEDYIIYAIISIVASSGANIVNIIYRRKFCKTVFTLHIDWKKHMPPIMLMFSMILMQTIYCNSDMTMLGLIKGDFQVGLYSTSVKIYNLVNQVVASIAWVVIPQLASGYSKCEYKRVNELLRYALSFIVTIGLPCIVGLNVICVPIIGTIGGEEYLEANISLHILTGALACSFIGGWIGNMMMIPSGREKICLKCGVLSATTNIVLNLYFIPLWGLNGAAFTTLIAEILGILVQIRYIDNRIKIDNVREIVRAPIVGSVFIIVIGLIVSHISSSYLVITFVTIGISILAYGIVLLILKNELFMSYAEPIIRKLKGEKE